MEKPILAIGIQLPEIVGDVKTLTMTINRDPVAEELPAQASHSIEGDVDTVEVSAVEGQHLQIKLVATDVDGREEVMEIKTQARGAVPVSFIGKMHIVSVTTEGQEAAGGAAGEEPTETGIDPSCRVCGCTEGDCSQCVEAGGGEACHWVDPEKTICSRCAAEIDVKAEAGGISKGQAEALIVAEKAPEADEQIP